MRSIRWAPSALADLASIEARWIDERPDYLIALFQAVSQAQRRLADQPGIGAPLPTGGRRKYRLGQTPYLIVYAHDAQALRILRVHHERQDWRAES